MASPPSSQSRPPPPALGEAGFRELARARLRDADVLHASKRFDGAVYLCGYAVEFVLKAHICRLLGWNEYLTSSEYSSFRTHDLNVLLNLSGAGNMNSLGTQFQIHWSTVLALWSNQLRYEPVGTMDEQNAGNMLEAVRELMVVL